MIINVGESSAKATSYDDTNTQLGASTTQGAIEALKFNTDKITSIICDQIQEDLIAKKDYAQGDFFIYQNCIYCVKTAISSGGNIVLGTNAQATFITNFLKDEWQLSTEPQVWGKDLNGNIIYERTFTGSFSGSSTGVRNIGLSGNGPVKDAFGYVGFSYNTGGGCTVCVNSTAYNSSSCYASVSVYDWAGIKLNIYGMGMYPTSYMVTIRY